MTNIGYTLGTVRPGIISCLSLTSSGVAAASDIKIVVVVAPFLEQTGIVIEEQSDGSDLLHRQRAALILRAG